MGCDCASDYAEEVGPHRGFTLMTSFKVLSLVLALYFGCTVLDGQTSTSLGSSTDAKGTPLAAIVPGSPAGSFALSDFEQINLYNGHLNISLPLLYVNGRGKAGFTLTLGISRPPWIAETPLKQVCYVPASQQVCHYEWSSSPSSDWWNPFSQPYGPGTLVVKHSVDKPLNCGTFDSPRVW